ncbi:type II toxin-antitoxin system RelB/DinJ family antitoxin [Selenomonas ruminantium]|jgi:DNA-damage-inducible protein J|uniref:type II toxin-antitoxin system RelB/DinJ family antitoxin n=1 Tax=Selenomonas ruminantium TaxID=971 RepID=UPI0004273B34|nr:type II toxin-antitoxin system RelB/DinJ family antitoxin [Selenomonas ruminantium]
MAQTTISIRMDDQLKHQFEDFCGAIGMSMTTAFNVFAKAAVREQKIPFEISAKTVSATTTSDNQVANDDIAMNLAARLIAENRPALEVLAK